MRRRTTTSQHNKMSFGQNNNMFPTRHLVSNSSSSTPCGWIPNLIWPLCTCPWQHILMVDTFWFSQQQKYWTYLCTRDSQWDGPWYHNNHSGDHQPNPHPTSFASKRGDKFFIAILATKKRQ